MFDYSALKGKIIEVFSSQGAFAYSMGLSERTVSLKMNGERCWKDKEIMKAIKLLEIKEKDIPKYFFNTKVQ